MARNMLYDAKSLLLFEESSTFLSRVDVRVKILYILVSIATAFYVQSLYMLIALLLANIALISIDRSVLLRYLSLTKFLAPFIALLYAINIGLTVALTDENIFDALYTQTKAVLRVFVCSLPILVLFATATPMQILQALTKLGIKYVYLYPFIVALRFIPILLSEMG